MNSKTTSDHMTIIRGANVELELNCPDGWIVDEVLDTRIYWDSEVQLHEDMIQIIPHISSICLEYSRDNYTMDEEDVDNHRRMQYIALDSLADTSPDGYKIEFRYKFGFVNSEHGMFKPTRVEIHYLQPSKSRDVKTIRAIVTFN